MGETHKLNLFVGAKIMADYTYEEQRDFARMNIETQLSYAIKNKDGQSYTATSNDLSATGLAMTTDHKLSLGDKIDIVMNAAGDRLPPFVAEGKVIRVENNDNESFNVSVSITLK